VRARGRARDARAAFHRILLGQEDVLATREGLVRCADGSQRLNRMHDTPLTDAWVRSSARVSSGEDITELRRNQRERAALQAQLLQTQKWKASAASPAASPTI